MVVSSPSGNHIATIVKTGNISIAQISLLYSFSFLEKYAESRLLTSPTLSNTTNFATSLSI